MRQTNRRNIGDILYKPSGLEPLTVSRCLVIWTTLTDFAISKNYNSWKKLDDYDRGEVHQIEYSVIEESREWITWQKYSESSLFDTREWAMEFVYKKAKEILDIQDTDETPNIQDLEQPEPL